jgi:hypothetical protein
MKMVNGKWEMGDGAVGASLIRYHYTYCGGLNLSKHSSMVGSSVHIQYRLVGKKHIYLADSRTLEAFTFNQEHGFQDLIMTIELQIPYSLTCLVEASFLSHS